MNTSHEIHNFNDENNFVQFLFLYFLRYNLCSNLAIPPFYHTKQKKSKVNQSSISTKYYTSKNEKNSP